MDSNEEGSPPSGIGLFFENILQSTDAALQSLDEIANSFDDNAPSFQDEDDPLPPSQVLEDNFSKVFLSKLEKVVEVVAKAAGKADEAMETVRLGKRVRDAIKCLTDVEPSLIVHLIDPHADANDKYVSLQLVEFKKATAEASKMAAARIKGGNISRSLGAGGGPCQSKQKCAMSSIGKCVDCEKFVCREVCGSFCPECYIFRCYYCAPGCDFCITGGHLIKVASPGIGCRGVVCASCSVNPKCNGGAKGCLKGAVRNWCSEGCEKEVDVSKVCTL